MRWVVYHYRELLEIWFLLENWCVTLPPYRQGSLCLGLPDSTFRLPSPPQCGVMSRQAPCHAVMCATRLSLYAPVWFATNGSVKGLVSFRAHTVTKCFIGETSWRNTYSVGMICLSWNTKLLWIYILRIIKRDQWRKEICPMKWFPYSLKKFEPVILESKTSLSLRILFLILAKS